jgi:hypothetical protein
MADIELFAKVVIPLHGSQKTKSISSTYHYIKPSFLTLAYGRRICRYQDLVSETGRSRELSVLQAISVLPGHHYESSRLNQMIGCFILAGPNGTHDCLVLELLGPSVADVVET